MFRDKRPLSGRFLVIVYLLSAAVIQGAATPDPLPPTLRPQLSVQSGHTSWVNCLAFSSDGKILASGSADQTIKIWDVATKTVARTIMPNFHVESLELLPGKPLLICAQFTGGSLENRMPGVSVWDYTTGECQAEGEVSFPIIHTLTVSPNARYVAIAGATMRMEQEQGGSSPSYALNVTGKLFVANASSLELVARYEREHDAFHSLAFSSNSGILAAGCSSGDLILLDPASGRTLHTVRSAHNDGIRLLCAARSTPLLVSLGGGKIKLWNPSDARVLKTIDCPCADPTAMALSDNGWYLYLGDEEGRLRCLDLNEGSLMWSVPAHEKPIRDVAWCPGSGIVATGGEDHLVKLWDGATGRAK